jgi:S1-C subfamily serine protease
MVRSRLGDPALSRRVALLDERLAIVREARGPVQPILRERAALLRQIAYPWLKSTAPAGLEAEHRRAVQATHTRTDQEGTRERARADLFPASPAGRARVCAGYALLLGTACLGVFLLLSLLRPARRAPRLDELFAQLAPAVPLIDAPGVGTGSGFLVRHDGRHLVVTNRHVVEHARNGIKVIFLRSAQAGNEEQLEVPSSRARLVAVHRSVDLAVIDVSADAARLAAWNIQPVPLAPSNYTAAVGKHVFAIGHPGDASGGVLTRTLSEGTISAVGRQFKAVSGMFTQVQVAINPGNSGGPIFDDDGKVIAVATFIIRRARDKDIALEGLNFGLDVRFVHDILNDPSNSLTPKEIASLLDGSKLPEAPPSDSPLLLEMEAKLKALGSQGYRPFSGDLKTSVVPFRVGGAGQFPFALRGLRRGDQTAVFVVSRGSANVGLFVQDLLGRPIVESPAGGPDPMVAFRVNTPGDFQLRVLNGTGRAADGVMVLLLK